MTGIEWKAKPGEIRSLEEGLVHVWRVSLEQEPAERSWDTILSEEELRRAKRFVFEKDRHTYTATRGILRTLLGEYLGLEPSAVRFVYNSFGKPSLDVLQNPGEITFNVSHSQQFSLLAFGVKAEVGVDLEYVKNESVAEIAPIVLAPTELAWWMQTPAAAQERTFLRLWTHKEAIVKAIGCGLSAPLPNIEFALPPTETIRIRNGIPEIGALNGWQLCDLDVHAEYLAALAVQSGSVEILRWDWRQNDQNQGVITPRYAPSAERGSPSGTPNPPLPRRGFPSDEVA